MNLKKGVLNEVSIMLMNISMGFYFIINFNFLFSFDYFQLYNAQQNKRTILKLIIEETGASMSRFIIYFFQLYFQSRNGSALEIQQKLKSIDIELIANK